jgi:hypothetical protein
LLSLGLVAVACGRFPDPTAVPTRPALPTRFERITPTALATPRVATPTPGPTPRRAFQAIELDPFVALYATEREGLFVTSRRRTARYFYRWDDARWQTIADRVWFRSEKDLRTVYPNRVAAP